MKSIIKYLMLILSLSIVITGFAAAETVYVKGVMKITMRTGPSPNHKIVTMVKSGEALEMIDRKNDWSQVKTVDGKQGWVLTRFITTNTPAILMFNELKKKNKILSKMLDNVKQRNTALSNKAGQLMAIEKSYYRLKRESANFLSFEKKYKKIKTKFQEQQDNIKRLEKELRNEDIKWFLSGGGVLLVGILLGMSSKKKRTNSLL